MVPPWLILALATAGPAPSTSAPPAALGPDVLPYPASSTSEPVVQAWINHYLPSRGFVVGAWSANVVMLVSTAKLQADKFPLVATEVRTEVLRPDAAALAGWRVAIAQMVFACDRDQYRTISSRYYKRGDRKGRVDVELGGDTWLTPEDGATMDTVERAACFYGAHSPTTPAAAPPPTGPQTAPSNAHQPAPQAGPTPSLHGLQSPH